MMIGGSGEHLEVNFGALVSRESNEANLASFLRSKNSLESPTRGEDLIWIGIANHLVELQQVNVVSPKAPERFLELAGGAGLCASIDFRHQEGFFTITILEGFPHTNFALSAVVVPAVVQEVDAFIEGLSNNCEALAGIGLLTEVITTDTNHRNAFARTA